MNAIVGWAHLLQRGQLTPDEMGRAIDTILRNATAQNQIIDELLDVSRTVTGKLQLDLRTASLSSTVCVCAAARSRRRRCRHMLGRKIVAKHSWPDSSTTFQSLWTLPICSPSSRKWPARVRAEMRNDRPGHCPWALAGSRHAREKCLRQAAVSRSCIPSSGCRGSSC